MAIDLFIPSSNFHLNLSFSNFVQTEGEMNKNIAIYKYSKLGGGRITASNFPCNNVNLT